MPSISNTLIGTAGEHLVAAQLSIRGFSAGLTRGGSKAVDVLASNADGSRSIAIQVKASYNARDEKKTKKEKSRWSFMLSTSDIRKSASGLIYVFVSFRGMSVDSPEYFIMSGDIVSQRLEEKYRNRTARKTDIRMLDIYEHEKESFQNRWDYIENALA